MLKIDIQGDLSKLLTLDKQITFAAASSLTKVAKLAQAESVKALDDEFHLRGTWYKQSQKHGIKVKPAKKTDLESCIYTSADWLLEGEGANSGIKRPDKGGSHLAVPDVKETRHGIGSVVRKTEKARYLLANPEKTRAFKVTTKSGYTLILQRKGGRGGRGGNTSKVVTKYIFRKSVKVPHQSAVVKPTQRTVLRYMGQLFSDQLRIAIQTSKVSNP